MSIIEDRLLGFLWAFSFLMKGFVSRSGETTFPFLAPYLRQAPPFGLFGYLRFPYSVLRTLYMDVFWRISILPEGLSEG